jgi:hypothetical protein
VVSETELPPGHPVALLIRRRGEVVAKREACMRAYERSKSSAIQQRTLAEQAEEELRELDACIKQLNKENRHGR